MNLPTEIRLKKPSEVRFDMIINNKGREILIDRQAKLFKVDKILDGRYKWLRLNIILFRFNSGSRSP